MQKISPLRKQHVNYQFPIVSGQSQTQKISSVQIF